MGEEYEHTKEYHNLIKDFCKILKSNGETDSDNLNKVGHEIFKNEWGGVYPEDAKIKFNKNHSYYIFNNQQSDEAGEHWIALYVNHDNEIIYVFDTFDRQLSHLIPDLDISIKDQHFYVRKPEHRILQTDKQENCGQRSLSWLFLVKKYGIDEVYNNI